jgi:hypothetical protein
MYSIVLNNFLDQQFHEFIRGVGRISTEANVISCLFRQENQGIYATIIVLKTFSFISFFYILACSYWGDYRLRFCFLPLSSIFPFMSFWTKKERELTVMVVLADRMEGPSKFQQKGMAVLTVTSKRPQDCVFTKRRYLLFTSCTYINYFNNTVQITVLTISVWNCRWRPYTNKDKR